MSFSARIERRLSQREFWRKGCAWIYIIMGAAYLIWRLTIFSTVDFGMSLIFYCAEVIGFILALVSIFIGWNYRHRKVIPSPPNKKIDVYIPVFKEPEEMIRLTVIAAKSISYPHETYLLDDGKRDELRELASEIGIHYLRREENKGAKAGNMNAALSQTQGEFILVFDADHIAQVGAIDVLLGQFEHENVAMVQAPQDYYNTDSIQYLSSNKAGLLWHDQSHFYNIALACRDSCNASTGVGTGVIYRRSSLEKIGKFPEQTVTEDIHSSLRFHKAGFETRFVNEHIAYGVAAGDIYDYYRTRHRWAHGNLHALSEENILTCKGLTLKQRISYLCFGLIHLEGWQQLIIILAPVLSLIFGWHPFEITLWNSIIVMGFPLVTLGFIQEQGGGLNRYWSNEVFAISRMPIQLTCLGGIFRRKIKWVSSLKNLRGEFSWGLVTPQLIILGLSLLAISIGVWRWSYGIAWGPISEYFFGGAETINTASYQRASDDSGKVLGVRGYSLDLLIISGFWATYNLMRSGFWLSAIRSRTLSTQEHTHFALALPIYSDLNYLGITQWVSTHEMMFSQSSMAGKSEAQIKIMLPGESRDMQIHRVDGDLWSFQFKDQAERDEWNKVLFSLDWQRELQTRDICFMTVFDFVRYLITFGKKGSQDYAKWHPKLDIFSDHASSLCFLGKYHKSKQYEALLFRPCTAGEILKLCVPGTETEQTFKVIQEGDYNGHSRVSLNGIRFFRYRLSENANEPALEV